MNAASLDPDPALIREGGLSIQSGYSAAMELLNQPNRPTAILCAVDSVAFGAMAACREHGLMVERDVSIIGYSNSPMSSFCEPPLTTIEHRVFENGGRVGKTLLRLSAATVQCPPATWNPTRSCRVLPMGRARNRHKKTL